MQEAKGVSALSRGAPSPREPFRKRTFSHTRGTPRKMVGLQATSEFLRVPLSASGRANHVV